MQPIKWAYKSPDAHTHRPSGWSFVDDSVNGEIVLMCGRCDACWHTGLPDTGEWFDTDDLKRAAARWLVLDWFGLARRQLVLPLVIEDAPIREMPKRRYTPAPRIDMSAQMALPLAA